MVDLSRESLSAIVEEVLNAGNFTTTFTTPSNELADAKLVVEKKERDYYARLFKKALKDYSLNKTAAYSLRYGIISNQAEIVICCNGKKIVQGGSFNFTEREVKNRYCIFKIYNDVDKYFDHIGMHGVTDYFGTETPL